MSFGDESGTEFATAHGRDWPSVRQYNVFLENRVGALLDLVRRFETTDVRIISLNIVDTSDCAIIRLLLSDPERAYEILERGKFMFTESDLLVVQLPEGRQPLVNICKTLLAAEINVHYAYPLLVGPQGHSAIALHVEDHEMAVQTLQSRDFVIFSENDLEQD